MEHLNNAIININQQEKSVDVIQYQNQRVVTLKMIDELHQRTSGTARRIFNENKNRFIENKHFFKVCANEIRTHKILSISDKAHEDITLITEAGYLMIAKSLTDDLAWHVQDALIESYFKIKQAPTIPTLPFDMTDPLSIMDWSKQQFLTFKQREETKDAIIQEQSRVILSQVEHLEANKEIDIFVKQMQESKKSKSFTDIAKLLSDAFDYTINAENLMTFCILKGFLTLTRLPSDKLRSKKYFKVFAMYLENTGDVQIKTRITGNGLMFLSQEVKPYKVFFTLKRAEWKPLLEAVSNGGKLRKEFMANLKDATHYSAVNQNELLV